MVIDDTQVENYRFNMGKKKSTFFLGDLEYIFEPQSPGQLPYFPSPSCHLCYIYSQNQEDNSILEKILIYTWCF